MESRGDKDGNLIVSNSSFVEFRDQRSQDGAIGNWSSNIADHDANALCIFGDMLKIRSADALCKASVIACAGFSSKGMGGFRTITGSQPLGNRTCSSCLP